METIVARTGMWQLQIVRRCDQHRFVVVPKRWIVERTLAWISRCRRPRLRASRSQGSSVRPPRHDPPHAAPSRPKPLIKNQNFAEGLLGPLAERQRTNLKRATDIVLVEDGAVIYWPRTGEQFTDTAYAMARVQATLA